MKATNPEHPRPSLTPSRAQGASPSVLEGLQLRNSAVCVHLVLTRPDMKPDLKYIHMGY